VVWGVKGATRGDLFARPEMDGEAFDPEGETAVVAWGVSNSRGGGNFVSSWDAPFPFGQDHPAEMVAEFRLRIIACSASDANAWKAGGKE